MASKVGMIAKRNRLMELAYIINFVSPPAVKTPAIAQLIQSNIT